jgi:hypothetical protein
MATALGKGEPGKRPVDFNGSMAGLGERKSSVGFTGGRALACGRNRALDFTRWLATAFGIGEPGMASLGITREMAGLGERISPLGIKSSLALAGGRTADLGFRGPLATAVGIGEPGTPFLGINPDLAGLGERIP